MLFASSRMVAFDMSIAMRWYNDAAGQLIVPHTAFGLAAARLIDVEPAIPMVTLATAHPAKFPEAVERATGQRPSLPARVGDLFDREEKYASRSEEHTSELQSLMRISYAVFCLKKKITTHHNNSTQNNTKTIPRRHINTHHTHTH